MLDYIAILDKVDYLKETMKKKQIWNVMTTSIEDRFHSFV